MTRAARAKKAVGGGEVLSTRVASKRKQVTRKNVNPTNPVAGGDCNGVGTDLEGQTQLPSSTNKDKVKIKELQKEIAAMKGQLRVECILRELIHICLHP
jgi:hypothetical protein